VGFLFARSDDISWFSLIFEELEIDQLKELIESTTAPVKEKLPLGKLAQFGTLPSPPDENGKGGGSLRHDANVRMVTGCEGDYDGEQMPIEEARDRLNQAGLVFVIHTTAGHAAQKPRWRVWLPFSRPLPPTARARMINRLNGVLGGDLARESWTLSQAFYIGRVDGVAFEIYVGDGDEYIDEADELDPGLGFQPAPGQPRQATKGSNGGKQAAPDYPNLTEPDLRVEIQSGRHYYGPSIELLKRWEYLGVTQADAEANLRAIFAAVPQDLRTRKWSQGQSSIPRWAADVYNRAAKKKGSFLHNLITFLGDDPRWRGGIRHNDFTYTIEVCDPFPPQLGQAMTAYRALRDPIDIIRTLLDVQQNGFPTASQKNVWDALIAVAHDHAYHPVRDWLTSLEWDGVARIERLFLDYFPGELPSEEEADRIDRDNRKTPRSRTLCYLRGIGKRFMVSGVARVFEPGCKVDTVVVLVGPEGYDKSTGLRALVPNPAWYTDDVSPNLIDRDTKESLTGKWILELAEMPHIRRDNEKFKAFLSRQADRFRQAYGRASEDRRRQGIFCGTSNDLQLTSETGNRRIWPARVNRKVKVAAIKRDCEQLWAEAAYWYRQGFEWWLPPEIEAIARQVQEDFLEEDTWVAAIGDWLDGCGPADIVGCDATTTAKLSAGRKKERQLGFALRELLDGLGFSRRSGDPNTAKKSDEARARRVLKLLGYRRDPHRTRRAGGQDRLWFPPKTTDETDEVPGA
jgi:predicted P-loop ATPase